MDDFRLDDSSAGIDVKKLVRDHGRQATVVAACEALLVGAVVAACFLWGQPVRRMSVLEFRPTFTGAAEGAYPNDLPFSSTDVVSALLLDLVYDKNRIADYCSREAFRSGFFIEQRSDASAFLDAEYQARLSDAGITPV